MRQANRFSGGWAVAAGIIAVLLLLTTLSGCPWFKPKPPSDQHPPTNDPGNDPSAPPTFVSADPGGGLYAARDGVDTAAGDAAGAPETGDQPVREVVEPDVIRKDGSLLYILNQFRGLTIVDLDKRAVVGSVPTLGYPRDLYLVNGMAYVLTGYAADTRVENGQVSVNIASRLYAVDVSDPASPAIAGELALEGDFIDSRMAGDVLYAVSASFQYVWDTVPPAESGDVVQGEPGGAGVVKAQTSSSWVTSVNLADPSAMRPVETLSLEGYGSIVQTGENFLFVASPDWWSQQTAITLVDFGNAEGHIQTRGTATVEGIVADRFKMNAWNGVLRVATNYWYQNASGGTSLETEVTTFSLADPDKPERLGRLILENASGETLYASRFDGPRAYLVTFLRVDPLFVVDLSDPVNPRKTGELKVPGYSVHIEPRGNRLVGIGMDDSSGTWKVAATLFDVSDPASPAELSRVTVGDGWGWSPAFSDVKALTVLDDMILLPVSGWTDAGAYDRVQWIQWTGDTLTPLGTVDVQGAALRTFRAGDLYYCVTPDEVDVIALRDVNPVVETVIPLTADVRDCVKVANGKWVRVVAKKNGQTASIETAATVDGLPLAEVALPDADVVDTLVVGNDVVVISRGWDPGTGAGYYSGTRVSVDDAGNMAPRWSNKWAVQPWWGWWWGWYDVLPMAGPSVRGGGVVAEDVMSAGAVSSGDAAVSSSKRVMPGYWWWPRAGDNRAVLLAGGKLVLRCYADSWTGIVGGDTPWHGLAIVDAASGNLEGTVGLGFPETGNVGVDPSGRILLSYKDARTMDAAGRPVCAWYLALLDPASRQVVASANVPGNALSTPGSGCYLLDDWQYAPDGSVIRQVNTITWNGGAQDNVRLVESVPLGRDWGDLQATGGTAWVTRYDATWTLERLLFNGEGHLTARESMVPGPSWASLLAWNESRVCAQTDGNVLIQMAFSGDGSPVIESVVGVMGWPVKGRLVDDVGVVCLGKAGIALLGHGAGML
ncbi:MAG TPA: beta-propeller domain-containing protein [Candidatus Hydrogenedentes bacterium]|nr:beta-propeller domain-containing protein [Candidatus Hydrogenedentota bacterium]